MSKARQLADLGNVYDDGGISGSNLLINSAMQVAQRGTSFTSNSYGLDHWYNAFGGSATVTQDTSDVPSNFKYAMKTTTTAASSFATFYQPFEEIDYERFKGQTVTISFYIKVNSTFVGNMSIDMQSGDTANTLLGGTWAANDAKTITPTTTWQRYEVTLTVATSNGVRLNIGPSQAQASGAEYSFTGVQLEIGDSSTPFEHRSYADQLQACQRYYQKSYPQAVTPSDSYVGGVEGPLAAHATSYAYGSVINYPVIMRTYPTITFYANAGTSGTAGKWAYYNGTWNVADSIGAAVVTDSFFTPSVTKSSGYTAQNVYLFSGNYTLDAEL